MSFRQAFPTTRDPHRDARMVNSTRKDHTTMDVARAPHPTREGACAPLTVNSTRNDHTTMDAARAPHPTREGACAPLSHPLTPSASASQLRILGHMVLTDERLA